MLRVTILGDLKTQPQVADGQTVIVTDAHQVPLVIVHQTADGVTLVHTLRDPEFQSMLRQLGLGRIVVSSQAAAPRLSGETISAESLKQTLARTAI